jgi:hypothetical protein
MTRQRGLIGFTCPSDNIAVRRLRLLSKDQDLPRQDEAEYAWYSVTNVSEITGAKELRVEHVSLKPVSP